MGAMMPNKRPQKLATPHAVPLIGAANASGVQPYRTALNMDWKKLRRVSRALWLPHERPVTYYSIMLSPMLDACVLTAEKTKMLTPIKAAEMIIVNWRPRRGTRYIIAPSTTPTMPGV